MIKQKKQIFGILFLVLTLAAIIYISLGVKKERKFEILFIAIEGENHLSKEQYLNFASLNNKDEYRSLNLQIIKDRIEKHPYIQSTEVTYSSGKVLIKLIEKTFDSMLMKNGDQYILTEGLQVLPLLPQTKKVDFPIINEPFMKDTVKTLTSMANNRDVIAASKILSAVKLINPNLHDNISTLDMQNGGEINIYLSNSDYPVIIGRGNEIRKMFYFNSFWSAIEGKEYNNQLEFVDLRFGSHLYFKLLESNILVEEMKS